MNIVNRTTELHDLTKSTSVVIELPVQKRNFPRARGNGHGPVNSVSMASSVGNISSYGSGSYGYGLYESVEMFSRFIESFKEFDQGLVECIHNGFIAIFKENKNV